MRRSSRVSQTLSALPLCFVGACFNPGDAEPAGSGTTTTDGASETGDPEGSETQAPTGSSQGLTTSSASQSSAADTSAGETTGAEDGTTTSAETETGEPTTGGMDSCLDLACENGGRCVAGACACDGTGYEGATCSDDTDECAADEPACSAYAVCTNDTGSFACECGEFADGDAYVPAGCCPEQEVYTCGVAGAFGPCEPFPTGADELVSDSSTGLQWSRVPEEGEFDWGQAEAVCTGKSMRVPTRTELESLVVEVYEPTWMPCVYERGVNDSFWTSTVVGGASANVVHFSFGGTGNDVQTNSYGVRCVQ